MFSFTRALRVPSSGHGAPEAGSFSAAAPDGSANTGMRPFGRGASEGAEKTSPLVGAAARVEPDRVDRVRVVVEDAARAGRREVEGAIAGAESAG